MFYTLHVVEPLRCDSVLIKETNEWMRSVVCRLRSVIRCGITGRTENFTSSVGRGFGTTWWKVVASSLGQWSQAGNAHCCCVVSYRVLAQWVVQ